MLCYVIINRLYVASYASSTSAPGISCNNFNCNCYIDDKLSKNILTPYIWRPLKISPTKVEKPHVRDRALPSCKYSRRSALDICPGQTCIFFLIRDSFFDSLWATVLCYTFWEALVEPVLRPI